MDADDLATLLLVYYEALGQPAQLVLEGDGREWVSVRIEKGGPNGPA